MKIHPKAIILRRIRKKQDYANVFRGEVGERVLRDILKAGRVHLPVNNDKEEGMRILALSIYKAVHGSTDSLLEQLKQLDNNDYELEE